MKNWLASHNWVLFILPIAVGVLISWLGRVWSGRHERRREREQRVELDRQAEVKRLEREEEKRKKQEEDQRRERERAALIQSLRTPEGKDSYFQGLSQNYFTVDLELLECAIKGASGLGIALPENIVPRLVEGLVDIYCKGSTSYHYYGGSRAYECGSYYSTDARAKKNRDEANIEYQKGHRAKDILILLSRGWEVGDSIKKCRDAIESHIASRTMGDDSAGDHACGIANDETVAMLNEILRAY